MPVGLGEQDGGRRLQVRGQTRVGGGLDVGRRGSRRRARAVPSTSIVSVPHDDADAGPPERSRGTRRGGRTGRLSRVMLAAGDGAGDDERAGLDAVGHDAVLRAAQPLAALDLDRVGVGPLDLGAHLAGGTR